VEKEKIHLLKRELNEKNQKELIEICIGLAKLKIENKEMLTYLLFDSENPLSYAEKLKVEISNHFSELNFHYYYSTKSLRKTIRLILKYSRFTKFKQGEIELLLHFSKKFNDNIPQNTSHLPLLGLQFRCLKKAHALIQKTHPDFYADYSLEYNEILENTAQNFPSWKNEKFTLKKL
jgi:hypothetical protein